jgi:hypothetical protein
MNGHDRGHGYSNGRNRVPVADSDLSNFAILWGDEKVMDFFTYCVFWLVVIPTLGYLVGVHLGSRRR